MLYFWKCGKKHPQARNVHNLYIMCTNLFIIQETVLLFLFSSANIISLSFLGSYTSKLAHNYRIPGLNSKTLTQCKFSKQHYLSPDFNFSHSEHFVSNSLFGGRFEFFGGYHMDLVYSCWKPFDLTRF